MNPRDAAVLVILATLAIVLTGAGAFMVLSAYVEVRRGRVGDAIESAVLAFLCLGMGFIAPLAALAA